MKTRARNAVAVGREGAKKVCFRLPGPLMTETSTVECKRMRGTCFGAKNVESIFGKLAFGDLAFDNFPIISAGEAGSLSALLGNRLGFR